MIALPELPPLTNEAEKIRIAARLADFGARRPNAGPALQFKHVAPPPLDLSHSFLDAHNMSSRSRSSTVTYSVVVHAVILIVALLIPMWFADTLDIRTFTQTLLVAPLHPPPAPAAPPAAAIRAVSSAVRHQLVKKDQIMLPTYIPKAVAIVNEPEIAPEIAEASDGVAGGVAGGVPGGVPGGVLGGMMGAGAPPPVAAPARPVSSDAVKTPLRVGGQVKSPRAIFTPPPEYPLLAQRAHVEGVVDIDAIVDEHGNVINMHAVSGPGLLIAAALQAVSKWRYEPTILNGEPYPVSLVVQVTFHMG